MAMAAAAFFQRIFGGPSQSSEDEPWEPKVPDFQLDQQCVRLLSLSESAHGNASLLFDSKATQVFRAPFPENESVYDAIYDSQYAYKVANPRKHPNDVKEFAECMLGTIPIAYQTDVFKVGES